VAAQYHTTRFKLVPRLAKALAVPVPPVRKPGSAWADGPAPQVSLRDIAGRLVIRHRKEKRPAPVTSDRDAHAPGLPGPLIAG
jgi:hypothetical protein